ncbi:MAG TPA: glycosyltransferase [Vicinamibacterales bacterium]|jgi:glycosyltransferase involved in cell wall biosynthesis
MRPLRILHVTPYFTDAWAYGGIPRLATSLAGGLARRGHHVTVCTTDARDGSTRLTSAAPSRTPEGVEIRIFRNVSNALAYRLQFFVPLGLDPFLRRHAASFDVAHLHACRNIPGAIAAYHLQRTGVPYVLAPNGTAAAIERRVMAKRAFDLLAGQRVLNGAARVIAVSSAERLQFDDLGVPAPKVRSVPNPIDLAEFASRPVSGSFRTRFDLPASAPLVLFLGQQTPRKRVDVLVRAFARLERPGARLVIAGNDMGAEAATRALVKSLGLGQRTLFTGLLRGRERLEALSDADVVVYPSEHEVFGLVPLEAILSGTAVVVADDSGCAEVVGAIDGGQIVPLGDAAALADAIERVLGNPARWRAAAATGAERIRAIYDPDVICRAIEAVYFELVKTA